jgi:hypothetical protein
MTSDVTNPSGSRALKCVATTAKDLKISEADGIETSYEKWAQQRGNNYFRSAEWYAK